MKQKQFIEKMIAEIREKLHDKEVVEIDTMDYKTSKLISESVNLMCLRELMLSHEEHRKHRDVYDWVQNRFLQILEEYLKTQDH